MVHLEVTVVRLEVNPVAMKMEALDTSWIMLLGW